MPSWQADPYEDVKFVGHVVDNLADVGSDPRRRVWQTGYMFKIHDGAFLSCELNAVDFDLSGDLLVELEGQRGHVCQINLVHSEAMNVIGGQRDSNCAQCRLGQRSDAPLVREWDLRELRDSDGSRLPAAVCERYAQVL